MLTDTNYVRVPVMGKRRLETSEINAQETLRFEDDERVRLNAVLRELRAKAAADGWIIHKTHFIKALMGIREMQSLTNRHREFLLGRIPLESHGEFPPVVKTRDKKKPGA